jgi:hypothetical protein
MAELAAEQPVEAIDVNVVVVALAVETEHELSEKKLERSVELVQVYVAYRLLVTATQLPEAVTLTNEGARRCWHAVLLA